MKLGKAIIILYTALQTESNKLCKLNCNFKTKGKNKFFTITVKLNINCILLTDQQIGN